MKGYIEIVDVIGREVMDSRGNPTVEVEVYVEGGHRRIHGPRCCSAPVHPPVSSRLASCVTATSPATTARAYSRLLTL